MWDCPVAGLSRNLAPGFYAGPSNSTEVTVELVLEFKFPELEWKMCLYHEKTTQEPHRY